MAFKLTLGTLSVDLHFAFVAEDGKKKEGKKPETSKFAGVSVTSQLVNYCVFAALLVVFPALVPEFALLLACFVSMFVSYTGFRFGVFRGVSGKAEAPPE